MLAQHLWEMHRIVVAPIAQDEFEGIGVTSSASPRWARFTSLLSHEEGVAEGDLDARVTREARGIFSCGHPPRQVRDGPAETHSLFLIFMSACCKMSVIFVMSGILLHE